MFFEHISFDVRNVAICQFPKDKARVEREARASLVSSFVHAAIKTLHVRDVKNWARNVLEVRASGSMIRSKHLIVSAISNEPNSTSPRTSNPRPGSRDVISIAHLLNTPPDDEFARHFPIHAGHNFPVDEDGDSAFVDPESPSEASHWSEDAERYDPYVGATDSAFDGFFESLETLTFGHTAFRPDDLSSNIPVVAASSDAMAQALEPRALEIRQTLSNTAGNFGSTLPEAQHMLELGPAIEQITGSEVDSLITLFFENYHRHCPIIHRPSFHPTLCPLPLLLSVMALGGMYAPETVRKHRMRALLDVIEAYIYSLPGLRDEYTNSLDLSKATDEDTLQFQFELLEGAYLIIIAQYFSGNVAGKRRARRQRFTRVLDVLDSPFFHLVSS